MISKLYVIFSKTINQTVHIGLCLPDKNIRLYGNFNIKVKYCKIEINICNFWLVLPLKIW